MKPKPNKDSSRRSWKKQNIETSAGLTWISYSQSSWFNKKRLDYSRVQGDRCCWAKRTYKLILSLIKKKWNLPTTFVQIFCRLMTAHCVLHLDWLLCVSLSNLNNFPSGADLAFVAYRLLYCKVLHTSIKLLISTPECIRFALVVYKRF